jgi:protein-S-isoprenylcysteine O-methyltransferase Ste14
VAEGLYRYSRNPMYFGVLLAILGQGLITGSLLVFGYAALMWLAFHGFVRLYEEPELTRRFGTEYEAYRRLVPRWIGVPRRTQDGR